MFGMSSYQRNVNSLKEKGVDIVPDDSSSLVNSIKIRINQEEIVLHISEAKYLADWIMGVAGNVYNNIPD